MAFCTSSATQTAIIQRAGSAQLPTCAAGLPTLAPTVRTASSTRARLSVRANASDGASATTSAPSKSLMDMMAFSGVAPEMINGRVSMIAFVAAVEAEWSSGESVTQQLADAPLAVAAFIGLITAASFIPSLRSDSMDPADSFAVDKSPFVPKPNDLYPPNSVLHPFVNPIEIEKWNGRGAMIGLTMLFLIESLTSKALF
mmetsp:Transcript_18883/g.22610  ORF Transcript_18883/g.22610 Transcript_18883/m.22610 type:complete len:200 (-) Transcript_18883:116-715(-)|eukprot:CAMPEP_0197849416 /NCGR_PEP_ID=MMETSP1438-20131217/12007_1 /TAXON_ID=1461541 /ORGANISM="Pterosperma sp., Strain CCMP1384" /LENGTH=199 /DNA_ID=CAMNT_0043462093 /DNA_START=49 /DNA_END=648 /DNA_ORIENTATION=+